MYHGTYTIYLYIIHNNIQINCIMGLIQLSSAVIVAIGSIIRNNSIIFRIYVSGSGSDNTIPMKIPVISIKVSTLCIFIK